jgi:Skp family chaperone for outer membrane proteins
MKKNHWITLTVGIAIVLGMYAIPAITQQPTPPPQAPPPSLVAIIDLAKVIQWHPEFIRRQQDLKARAAQAEASIRTKQEKLAERQKGLETSQLVPGTPQYLQIADEITKSATDLQMEFKTLDRQFTLDNAKIMYDVFEDIKMSIGKYAEPRGIAQVTDQRDFKSNPLDPQTVIEDMDQRLVWYSKRLNITDTIIREIYAARNVPAPADLSVAPPGSAAAARTATAAPTPPGAPAAGVGVR